MTWAEKSFWSMSGNSKKSMETEFLINLEELELRLTGIDFLSLWTNNFQNQSKKALLDFSIWGSSTELIDWSTGRLP